METQIRRAGNENVFEKNWEGEACTGDTIAIRFPHFGLTLGQKWGVYGACSSSSELNPSLTRCRDELHHLEFGEVDESVERHASGYDPILRSNP